MKPSHRSNYLTKAAIVAGIVLTAGAVIVAQTPPAQTPIDYTKTNVSSERDEFWFETNVGSFKILPRGQTIPSGQLTMAFTGSVLISEMKGTITPEGNVRREYNNKQRGKEVWFGTGKLTLNGNFRAVQWFGRNLKAKFNGNGFIRLYGEFDKNLDTGYYWFKPTDKKYWGNYGVGVQIPEVTYGPTPNQVKTREELNKSKGKGGG
jgi:hypothetical protein